MKKTNIHTSYVSEKFFEKFLMGPRLTDIWNGKH